MTNKQSPRAVNSRGKHAGGSPHTDTQGTIQNHCCSAYKSNMGTRLKENPDLKRRRILSESLRNCQEQNAEISLSA